MAEKKYLGALKELVACYTDNGVILDEPTGRLGSLKLNPDVKSFLKQVVVLLMTSRMLCDESKMYLSNRYITYSGVAKELKETKNIDANPHTVQTKIWYDKGKIIRFFGERMLIDLIDYGNTDKLSEYQKMLEEAQNKYANSGLLSSIDLNMPDTTGAEPNSCDDEQFNDFIRIIAPYSKRHKEFISNNLPVSAVAYCKYLLDSPVLSEKELEHKEMLMELLE